MGFTGETVVLEATIQALCELGQSVTEVLSWSGKTSDLDALCDEDMPPVSMILSDWDFPPVISKHRCLDRQKTRIAVLDFFGFTKEFKAKELELRDYFTMCVPFVVS